MLHQLLVGGMVEWLGLWIEGSKPVSGSDLHPSLPMDSVVSPLGNKKQPTFLWGENPNEDREVCGINQFLIKTMKSAIHTTKIETVKSAIHTTLIRTIKSAIHITQIKTVKSAIRTTRIKTVKSAIDTTRIKTVKSATHTTQIDSEVCNTHNPD